MHIALLPLVPVWDAVGHGGGGSAGPGGMGDVSRSFRRRRVKEVVWMGGGRGTLARYSTALLLYCSGLLHWTAVLLGGQAQSS